ncbi:integrin beta-like protein 1, partial [Cherax quadricarinatus]|uniref:integrin beta-like protein 1 n=1 Tax=Cherax quadricarinatus TaxID=27406 RepID=UPI00387E80B4
MGDAAAPGSGDEVSLAAGTGLRGLAKGFTGLRPQHFKQMLNPAFEDISERLLSKLTKFSIVCLAGDVLEAIRPIFSDTSLCALREKDGGIGPIAVGNTLQCLAEAEVATGEHCERAGGECVTILTRCTTMLTKNDDCPPGKTCCSHCSDQRYCDNGRGVCKTRCQHEEYEVKDGCFASKCKCCTPRQPRCVAVDGCPGQCIEKKLCHSQMEDHHCSGHGCVCCNTCANRSPCDEGFGVCRASCFHLEREVKEGCGGPDCKCCTSRKADCSASAECPGICMDSRMCINPLSNFSCSGAGCVCCDKCNDHLLCNGGNGVCRDKCHIMEHETVGDCGYTGCKCCTPLKTICPHSDKCPGICMNNKFCTNPLKMESCAGSDCVCCD